MRGNVTAVSSSATHTMTKPNQSAIQLIAGLGVEGDAHAGTTVKHRSRVARDPSQPNLRQVHLIHAELHDTLHEAGFHVVPGQMGENITTQGIDLLGLPTGTRLHCGDTAIVEVTGLRNPCAQLEGIQVGLMAAVIDRNAAGDLIRKAGIMGVVIASGAVRPGDAITVELPPAPHQPLIPVSFCRPACKGGNIAQGAGSRSGIIGSGSPLSSVRVLTRRTSPERCSIATS